MKPFDLSWSNLIYGPGPRVIAFVLNAQINSVRTPDMLKLWGYVQSANCPLCQHKQCTLHHILVNCRFALEQGRYTWRHDSVLLDIETTFKKVITLFNSRKLWRNRKKRLQAKLYCCWCSGEKENIGPEKAEPVGLCKRLETASGL